MASTDASSYRLDTDVWFYALDPTDQRLLAANSSATQAKLTGKQAQTSLKYIVTGDFHVQVWALKVLTFFEIFALSEYIFDPVS